MSEPTSRQEEETADRLLDGQISNYQEEMHERRRAARWPTEMEYESYLDRLDDLGLLSETA